MRLRLDPFSQNGISSVQSNTTIIGTGTTTTGGGGASSLADLTDVDSTVASPSDGDIIVYRDAGSDWVLEAKPAGGSNPALNDVTDVTISAVADNEVLAYDSGTTTWINQTASEAGLAAASHTHTESDITDLGTYQVQLAEGAFVDGDKTKLDGIEAGADVTDTANVTAAGALMDSEVTNLAQVKAFDSADYATAAQGALADSALQNITGENIADLSDVVVTTPADNEVMAYDTTSGNWINQTASEAGIAAASHTHTASQVTDFDTEVSNNTDVAANTAARHDPVTVLDTSEIDLTLTGQQISASIVAGSIDETKLDTSTNASLDLADSSVQPGDNISTLTNDSGFITGSSPTITTPTLTLKQGLTPAPTAEGDIQWDTDNDQIKVGDGTGTKTFSDDTQLATSAQGALADSAVQPGDNISTLTNDSGFTSNTGDVVGPASATDNALATFDGTTGKLIQQDSTLLATGNSTLSAVTGQILHLSSTASVTIDNDNLKTNTINERVTASGVTIDGVLVKDGQVGGRDVAADGAKLDGIETGADVTDTANVTAAGALMDSEVDADIKTLSLPANTTISTFGASLIDDASNTAARTTLGLGTIATLAAPSGSVVGTSDTQTLTNKNLNSSTNTFPVMSSMGIISGATLGTTGNKSVTGVGFTPSVVRFEVIMVQSTASTAFGNGAMSSSVQFYTAGTVNTSVANDNVRIGSETDCIGWIGSGGTTASLLASYVSMDSDGFTINVSVANSAFAVAWIAYR